MYVLDAVPLLSIWSPCILTTSLQLGIPTANIPADDLSEKFPDLKTGVYYGVVALDPKKFSHENGTAGQTENSSGAVLLPTALSIGYNPYYKNTVRSVVCRDLHTHQLSPMEQCN